MDATSDVWRHLDPAPARQSSLPRVSAFRLKRIGHLHRGIRHHLTPMSPAARILSCRAHE